MVKIWDGILGNKYVKSNKINNPMEINEVYLKHSWLSLYKAVTQQTRSKQNKTEKLNLDLSRYK